MSLAPSRLATLAAACLTLAGLAAALAPSASAEVKKVMLQCEGKLCPLFLPQLAAPAGWSADEKASEANKVSILLPAGEDFGSAEAVIYARATFSTEKQTIHERAEISNKQWLAADKSARIERLADVPRAKGAAFEVYRYINPKNVQQRAEIVAFGEDADTDGNAYRLQIVLTTTGEGVLKKNQATFLSLLAGY